MEVCLANTICWRNCPSLLHSLDFLWKTADDVYDGFKGNLSHVIPSTKPIPNRNTYSSFHFLTEFQTGDFNRLPCTSSSGFRKFLVPKVYPKTLKGHNILWFVPSFYKLFYWWQIVLWILREYNVDFLMRNTILMEGHNFLKDIGRSEGS